MKNKLISLLAVVGLAAGVCGYSAEPTVMFGDPNQPGKRFYSTNVTRTTLENYVTDLATATGGVSTASAGVTAVSNLTVSVTAKNTAVSNLVVVADGKAVGGSNYAAVVDGKYSSSYNTNGLVIYGMAGTNYTLVFTNGTLRSVTVSP